MGFQLGFDQKMLSPLIQYQCIVKLQQQNSLDSLVSSKLPRFYEAMSMVLVIDDNILFQCSTFGFYFINRFSEP